MIKKNSGLEKFTLESAESTNDFKNKTNSIILTIKEYIAVASRELWKCDPQKHVEGKF